jgi:hypothetical protein
MFISLYTFTYPWSNLFSNYCQQLWEAVGLGYMSKFLLHVESENSVATLWGNHSLYLNFDYLNQNIYGLLWLIEKINRMLLSFFLFDALFTAFSKLPNFRMRLKDLKICLKDGGVLIWRLFKGRRDRLLYLKRCL